MRIQELKSLIADLPDNDHICFAVWFNSGEKLFAPHRELGPLRTVNAGEGSFNIEPNATYHIIGRCDDCAADTLKGT